VKRCKVEEASALLYVHKDIDVAPRTRLRRQPLDRAAHPASQKKMESLRQDVTTHAGIVMPEYLAGGTCEGPTPCHLANDAGGNGPLTRRPHVGRRSRGAQDRRREKALEWVRGGTRPTGRNRPSRRDTRAKIACRAGVSECSGQVPRCKEGLESADVSRYLSSLNIYRKMEITVCGHRQERHRPHTQDAGRAVCGGWMGPHTTVGLSEPR
jgi:hypothetical protein